MKAEKNDPLLEAIIPSQYLFIKNSRESHQKTPVLVESRRLLESSPAGLKMVQLMMNLFMALDLCKNVFSCKHSFRALFPDLENTSGNDWQCDNLNVVNIFCLIGFVLKTQGR